MRRFTEENIKLVTDEIAAYGDVLTKIPDLRGYLSGFGVSQEEARKITEIWVSKRFRVVVYRHIDGTESLVVHRFSIDLKQDRWEGGITWDELQDIKRRCGRGHKMAVEVYPADDNIVDADNNRHLWIIENPSSLEFAWANVFPKNKNKALNILTDRATQVLS